MAITLNDNIKLNAGKPLDRKYLSTGNTVYHTINEANLTIPIAERYVGLTVNVNNVEYWYKNGVADVNLVEKIYGTVIPQSDFITGATNIGYFSGQTGLQILPINHLISSDYDGNYCSLYNHYYRDINGVIKIGTPSDGINKRAYVKTSGLVKSWIWNEYTGSGNLLGWILLDGNADDLVGTFKSNGVPLYYNGTTTFPYTQTSWSSGVAYNNSSNLVIGTVLGSLTTGDTITIGGRPFAYKEDNKLFFKTIVSDTPNIFSVRDNDSIIHLSATTSSFVAQNVGSGVPVYSGVSNNIFYFKTLVGSGDTVVTNAGNTIVISSTSSGGSGDGMIDAANGLTRVGDVAVLGGILTGNTTINANCKSLTYISETSNCFNKVEYNLTGSYSTANYGICSRDGIGGSWALSGNSCNIKAYHMTNGSNGSCLSIGGNGITLQNMTSSVVKLVSMVDSGLNYGSCYHNDYTDRTLVDKEYVDKLVYINSNLINVKIVSNNGYITTQSDDFIGVSGSSCVYLNNTPAIGQRVIVADICGNALVDMINIDGNGYSILNGLKACINTDYGSTTFIFNGYFWSATSFVN